MAECGAEWLQQYATKRRRLNEGAPLSVPEQRLQAQWRYRERAVGTVVRVKREPGTESPPHAASAAAPPEVQAPVIEPTKMLYRVDGDRSALVMEFCVENNVYVTRFVNRHTGARFSFNLHALALALLPYYVEFSRRKFAKVNLRTLDGGSGLMYASGLLVETGSDNTVTSERMLAHTVDVLRHRCGYANLAIESRVCHNIVATGRVHAQLCLNVLRHRFPAASATRDKFTGVIIRLADLERHFAQEAYDAGHDGEEYAFCAALVDDDPQVIARINGAATVKREEGAAAPDDQEVTDVLLDAFGGADDAGGDDEESAAEPPRRAAGGDNGTFLIYKEGQFICAGCKSRRRLMSAHEKLFRLLEQCVSTPENEALERELTQRRQKW